MFQQHLFKIYGCSGNELLIISPLQFNFMAQGPPETLWVTLQTGRMSLRYMAFTFPSNIFTDITLPVIKQPKCPQHKAQKCHGLHASAMPSASVVTFSSSYDGVYTGAPFFSHLSHVLLTEHIYYINYTYTYFNQYNCHKQHNRSIFFRLHE